MEHSYETLSVFDTCDYVRIFLDVINALSSNRMFL